MGVAALSKMEYRLRLDCVRHFMSSLKKRHVAGNVFGGLSALVTNTLRVAFEQVKHAAISSAK